MLGRSDVVLLEQFGCYSAQVRVTRHPASKHDPVPLSEPGEKSHESTALHDQGSDKQFQEWRVLRFNEETVQSVARVSASRETLADRSELAQHPDCMAFLYMKTIGAAGSLQVFVAFEPASC